MLFCRSSTHNNYRSGALFCMLFITPLYIEPDFCKFSSHLRDSEVVFTFCCFGRVSLERELELQSLNFRILEHLPHFFAQAF